MNNELQDIISGEGSNGKTGIIKTAASYLRASQKASGKIIINEFTKEQEAAELIQFINTQKLWYTQVLNEKSKIGEGAEQKVFLQNKWHYVCKNK